VKDHKRTAVLSRYKQERNLGIALLLIAVILSLTTKGFLSSYSISMILYNSSLLGLMAIGMTVVIIMGEIDLSIGSLVAASSCLYSYFAVTRSWGLWLALIPSLLAGVVGGATMAFLRNRFRIPTFISSLAFFMIWRGVALVLTGSRTISGFDDSFGVLGAWSLFGTIPLLTLILAVIAAGAWFLLSRTSGGLYVYAIGSNERIARLTGVPVDRMRYTALIALGLLASFAGIVVTSNLMAGNPTVGEGFEMLVVAAVILGGTSLAGGSGTIIGALLGVVFLQLIESGLVLLGVDPFMMMLLRGTIILLAFFAGTVQQYGLAGVSRKTLATSQE